jgi:hypothetical protein
VATRLKESACLATETRNMFTCRCIKLCPDPDPLRKVRGADVGHDPRRVARPQLYALSHREPRGQLLLGGNSPVLSNYLGSVSTPVSTIHFKVNYLSADFLAIATQGLVNAKYQGSQILPCVYPSQRGIGVGFHCLTG